MSELPAGDTYDVIHRGNEVVAVVVPIVDTSSYARRWRNSASTSSSTLLAARKEAGAVRYVPHEEARRHLGLPAR